MKITSKTYIYYSLSLVMLLSIAIWFFFPVLLYKFIWTDDTLQNYLRVTPTYIEKLLMPPKEWGDIAIGELTLKLPISNYEKISGGDNYIDFRSKEGTLLITDLAPSKELVKVIKEKKSQYSVTTLQDRLSILKSLPTDISFFNSRQKNMQGSMNQTLKAMSIPLGGLGEVLIVDPKILKAVCIISEHKENKGYSAIVQVYSNNEAMSFGIMLMHYKDKATLNLDLLRLLGGLKVPNHSLDSETVKKDIDAVVTKYNRS